MIIYHPGASKYVVYYKKSYFYHNFYRQLYEFYSQHLLWYCYKYCLIVRLRFSV